MFIVSSKELVAAQCMAGIVGAFPALNARPQESLCTWIDYVEDRIGRWNDEHPEQPAAPYAVNLIVHPSNERLHADLDSVCDRKVPIVITSLNPPGNVVARVHGYGGMVLHDAATLRHARKAIDSGVDGVVLVTAGAGGHTGTINPLAFVDEVRQIYDGLVIMSGCISHGRQVLAAQVMGADLVYVGTRFIASQEANASAHYRRMIVESSAQDVVRTNVVTGLYANYLRGSFAALGIDIEAVSPRDSSSFSFGKRGDGSQVKAWRDVWSAGQGVGGIRDIQPAGKIIDNLVKEYQAARSQWCNTDPVRYSAWK